jgi:ERCC4-type nuclease
MSNSNNSNNNINNCSLIVDDREQAVLPYLPKNNIPYTINRITTGDFVIIKESFILAVFERKCLNDFADSLKDGRFDSQLKNMLELREKYIGCQIFYVIEGRAFPSDTDTFSRLPYTNIKGAINKLEILYKIQILKSKDSEHTAALIADKLRGYDKYWPDIKSRYAQPAQNLPEWPFELVYVLKFLLENPEFTNAELLRNCGSVYTKAAEFANFADIIASIRDKNEESLQKLNTMTTIWDNICKVKNINESLTETKNKDLYEIKMAVWCCIGGVSSMLAPTLIEKLSLKKLVCGEITVDMLTDLRYPSGKKLHASLTQIFLTNIKPDIELKMLKCIPGLGSKADILLQDRKLKDILALSVADLTNIKTGKNNLGPVKAEQILTIFY